jgi:hypothetical protein
MALLIIARPRLLVHVLSAEERERFSCGTASLTLCRNDVAQRGFPDHALSNGFLNCRKARRPGKRSDVDFGKF